LKENEMTDRASFFVVGFPGPPSVALEECGIFDSLEEAQGFIRRGRYHNTNGLPGGIVPMQVREEEDQFDTFVDLMLGDNSLGD
jgi:hypothetical protein